MVCVACWLSPAHLLLIPSGNLHCICCIDELLSPGLRSLGIDPGDFVDILLAEIRLSETRRPEQGTWHLAEPLTPLLGPDFDDLSLRMADAARAAMVGAEAREIAQGAPEPSHGSRKARSRSL